MFGQVFHLDLHFEVAIQNSCQLVFGIRISSIFDQLLLISSEIIIVGTSNKCPFDIKWLDHLNFEFVFIGLFKELLVFFVTSVYQHVSFVILAKRVVELEVNVLVRLLVERQVQRKVNLFVSTLLDFVNHVLVERYSILQRAIKILRFLVSLKLVLDLIVIEILNYWRILIVCLLAFDVLVSTKKVIDFGLDLRI